MADVVEQLRSLHTLGVFEAVEKGMKPTEIWLAAAAEIERLRAKTAWNEGDPPEDGTHIIAANIGTMRWTAYKPTSEQARRGIKGRWQRAGLHGGWDNAEKPSTWRLA